MTDGAITRCTNCGQANRVPVLEPGKAAVCGRCGTKLVRGGGVPVIATDDSFSEVISGGPVVVDFWAPWCGPCRVIAPVIEALAASRNDVTFAKLNVDENPRTQATFQVRGIPTLIFFKAGAEMGRIVGAAGRERIESEISRLFFSKGADSV